MRNQFIAALFLGLVFMGCTKPSVKNENPPELLAGSRLTTTADTEKILQNANPNVMIGAAVNVNLLPQTGAYRDLVIKHYNSLTAENAMKMTALQPQEGTFNFSNHAIEDLALNYGKKRIHGHTLVWHAALPQWVNNWETATLPAGTTRAAKFDSIMARHIRTVITNYSKHPASIYLDNAGNPLLKSWDVVNEAFDDNGNYRNTKNVVNGMDKGSVWYRTMGVSYLQKAFTYARMAAEANGNTNLKLFYNDYGFEYSQKKLDSIYKMVMALKQITVNGKPIIDGIGMQFHMNINTSNTMIKNAFIKLASTGLLLHISELDISLNKPGLPFSATVINQQRQRYEDVPFLFRRYVVAAQRWGITTWNVGDADSWLTYSNGTQVDGATLYNIDYTKKPAFYNFYNGLYLVIPPSY